MKQPLIVEIENEPPSSLSDPAHCRLPSTKESDEAAKPAQKSIKRQKRHVARTGSQHRSGFNIFPLVSRREWDDWVWQMKNRITCLSELERFVELDSEERAAFESMQHNLPFAITPYYLRLVDPANSNHALRRCIIPTRREQIRSVGESADPLGEDHDSPVPGLVHRYPDRVLFLSTSVCSTYCRYCTRSRLVGHHAHQSSTKDRWEKCIEYIEQNAEIRDVLISGGDPLTLGDGALEWLLGRLRAIQHVEIIRIGTKVPAVIPQRVTRDLVRVLKKFHPLWISIHFTHPEELTKEASIACSRLADAGIPLGSQTVLLKGINDDVQTLRSLFLGLMQMRVRPYYLYQCDPIVGSDHFRTSVDKGLDIIRGLRGHISGYAVPTYVIDAPGGGGKIPLLPDYNLGQEDGCVVLRNYENRLFRYPNQPSETADIRLQP